MVSEDLLQLEQAIIELDEQNTMNAIEISKREAKILLLRNQIEEYQDKENNEQEVDISAYEQHIQQHSTQIEILSESTKQNLIKRQSMKEQLFENYNKITQIRSSIHERIESDDVKEYLLLVIKCQFLESQNIQLLLNLQLQAKTISKYDKYFTNLTQNGGIPMECFEAMEEDDLLEDEEEEDEQDYEDEEDKFEIEDSKTPASHKVSTNDAKEGTKGTKGGRALNSKKSSLANNPYFKKNPYLVQQSKKRKK